MRLSPRRRPHAAPEIGTGENLASTVEGNGGPAVRNLRSLALRGGVYLAGRELIGMMVRLGGVAIVTRLLGPKLYGYYFGASTFVTVVASAAQMGAELWLIRQRDEPTQSDMDEVWTALAVVSAVVTAVALLLTLPAGFVVKGAPLELFRLLVLSVPINVLWAPAQARIERSFQYRKMAWIELGGDAVLYGVAAPLALSGFGAYSLVAGYLAWQTFLLVSSTVAARFRPHLRWNRRLTLDLVRHGLGYGSNDWAQRIGTVSATVVVGLVSGATGVGLVALALRLVETVGFALRATWRLGMATLSRLADNPVRLRRAFEQGMLAQSVALALPMLGVALLSPWLVSLVFGKAWRASAPLFCVLSVGSLIASPALLMTTLLYMQGRIADVTRGSAQRAGLLWTVSIPLTLWLGPLGYCVAVVVSTAGWFTVHRATRRVIDFSYRDTAVCFVGVIPALLIQTASFPWRWLLLLPLLIPLSDRRVRSRCRGLAEIALGSMSGRR